MYLLLGKFPRLKSKLRRIKAAILGRRAVSTGFTQLAQSQVEGERVRLRNAWQDSELPGRQRELADRQLALYRSGKSVAVFDVLVNAIKKLPVPDVSVGILEIGCSSGYYSEVFKIAHIYFRYVGCDYSSAFVDLAREKYPDLQFDIQDATSLSYPDESYSVVISGCCILHIPEYEWAMAETARVASMYVIFHRTPVLVGQSTTYFRKLAYGVEAMEIHFNESEFLNLLKKHSLELIETITLDEDVQQGVVNATKTYVCRKVKA